MQLTNVNLKEKVDREQILGRTQGRKYSGVTKGRKKKAEETKKENRDMEKAQEWQ